MAGADDLIAGLLAGTGFGRTQSDFTQQNLQNTNLAQANQIGAMKIATAQQQQQQDALDQRRFQVFSADYSANPTPDKLLNGMVQFPKQYQALKAAHDAKDQAAQTADLGYWSGIHSALSSGKTDIAANAIESRIKASKAAGMDTSADEQYLAGLRSGDPDTIKALTAQSLADIAIATGPANFAATYKTLGGGESKAFTLGQGQTRFDEDGKAIASVAPKDDYLVLPEGGKAIPLNGAPQLEGGGLASSGGGANGPAVGRGDVSRLINTDAGGGYVPDNVKTLGQFVGFGSALNHRGAKSSSAGTYQINGSTMAEFAPKVLGPDWKSAPFNAATQDKIGEGIFNWAKQQPNPPAALRGRWVSLNDATAKQLVAGSWQQARGTIAQGETGGGPGASAMAQTGSQSGDPAGTVYGAPKPGYQILRPEDVPAGLDPNTVYQRSPDGNITPIGGQKQGQLKPWPGKALDSRAANDAALKNINDSIWLLDPKNAARDARAKAAQGAVGFGTGMLGNRVTNWNDPDGVDFRARIGQIGGIIIKDTSGAAVSLSEDERLAKWVPKVDDAPATIRAKLNNLRRELAQRNESMDNTYNEDQGFRPFHQQIGSAKPLPKVGQVKSGYRFIGGNPADRNSWKAVQ